MCSVAKVGQERVASQAKTVLLMSSLTGVILWGVMNSLSSTFETAYKPQSLPTSFPVIILAVNISITVSVGQAVTVAA